MFSLASQIRDKIQDVEGVADLTVEQQIERPQLTLTPRREMLARYGITLPQFAEYVNACLAGEAVSQVYEQGKSFNLTVRLRDTAVRCRSAMWPTSARPWAPTASAART